MAFVAISLGLFIGRIYASENSVPALMVTCANSTSTVQCKTTNQWLTIQVGDTGGKFVTAEQQDPNCLERCNRTLLLPDGSSAVVNVTIVDQTIEFKAQFVASDSLNGIRLRCFSDVEGDVNTTEIMSIDPQKPSPQLHFNLTNATCTFTWKRKSEEVDTQVPYECTAVFPDDHRNTTNVTGLDAHYNMSGNITLFVRTANCTGMASSITVHGQSTSQAHNLLNSSTLGVNPIMVVEIVLPVLSVLLAVVVLLVLGAIVGYKCTKDSRGKNCSLRCVEDDGSGTGTDDQGHHVEGPRVVTDNGDVQKDGVVNKKDGGKKKDDGARKRVKKTQAH